MHIHIYTKVYAFKPKLLAIQSHTIYVYVQTHFFRLLLLTSLFVHMYVFVNDTCINIEICVHLRHKFCIAAPPVSQSWKLIV